MQKINFLFNVVPEFNLFYQDLRNGLDQKIDSINKKINQFLNREKFFPSNKKFELTEVKRDYLDSDKLPPEILKSIMQLSVTAETVKMLRLVCKTFYNYTDEEFSRLTLQRTGYSQEIIDYIILYKEKIEEMDLTGSLVNDKGIYYLALSCPQLKKLNLTKCHHITGQVFNYLLSACPNIESLSLENCQLIHTEKFPEFSSQFRALKHLNLSNCYITDEKLSQIAFNCPNLQSISIRHGCYSSDSLFLLLSNCSDLVIKTNDLEETPKLRLGKIKVENDQVVLENNY